MSVTVQRPRTLINSGVTPGTYGSSTLSAVITVDEKGRVTSVSEASISIPSTPNLSSVMAVGNSTGGTNLLMSTDDELRFRSGSDYIYSPSVGLVAFAVSGSFRMGGASDYLSVSSGGIVTFAGNGEYQVPSDRPAFSAAAAPSAGVWFQATGGARIQARDTAGTEIFAIRAAGTNAHHESARGIGQTATTPAQITSDQNNYAGANSSGFVRLDSDASRTITGLVAPSNNTGGRLFIFNVGSNDIVFSHQDTNSTAGNRIICSTGANITFGSLEFGEAFYDTTTNRWLLWKH